MGNPVLEQRYKEACADKASDIYLHLPAFVRTVESLNATKVIEIGVRYGVSTLAWLYALEGRGHLWSVDPSFPVAAPGSDVNLLDPQGPLGVQRHWTFLLGYCEWPEVQDALPQRVDAVFIDANHVFEETLNQLELYYPRIRPGGRILLHDSALEATGNAVTPQPPYPVRTAIEQFCYARDLKWDNNPACFGLGVIHVPGP